MKQFIRDLFQTHQPDGSYHWDMTNVAWSAIPWLVSALSFTAVSVYQAVTHDPTFSLLNMATGIGAVFAGGGIGVMLHSRSNT